MVGVSILVAAWNAQATLAAAIASVAAQSEPDWELILIADDGADYRRHLPDALTDDPRIRFLDSGAVAGGPCRARNIGLAQATGDFVAVLDADDLYAPDRLARLLPVAGEHGLASDCVHVVDADGATLRHAFAPGGTNRSLGPEEIMDCGVPLNPLMRRDLLDGGWPDLPFAEDVVLNLQLLDRAGCFPVVMEPLYHYIAHPASICHGPDAALRADAGYGVILAELDAGGFGLSPGMREIARAGFRAKQEKNRAFAAVLGEGKQLSFQEFMAQRG